ncbi:MAG: aryl-sulfate sulfotransferase, partial [Planctomycetota bacterium]
MRTLRSTPRRSPRRSPLRTAPLTLTALLTAATALSTQPTRAQTPAPGVHVFQPSSGTTTFVTDLAGNVVHSWPGTTRPGSAVYLAPNGDLVRTRFIANGPGGGGGGGAIERLTWDGDVLWQFNYTSATYHSHHDIALMPNGNVLMIAWESIGAAGATALGHDPATLSTQFWSEEIIEIEPDGAGGASVVWEWHAIDHIVQDFDAALPDFGDPSAHPERIDINYPEAGPGFDGDWLHANGIDYEPDLDQIVLSLRTFSEIWVIDHSTTTAEAAGSIGGDAG